MRFPKRYLGGAIAALLAASLVTGCSGPQPAAQERGGQLSIFLYQKPQGTFSPLEPASGPDYNVMSLIFQSLVMVTPDLALVPQLAEKVDISPDAKKFTFTLPKDRKWSDGQPFTSADVLFTYQRMANAKTGSAAAGVFGPVVGAADVKAGKTDEVSGLTAPDDHTFVIETTEPNVGILQDIGRFMILPKHILGDKPVENFSKDPFFKKPTVGLGPFTFVDYKVDQYVEFKANKNFPKQVGVEKIFLKPVTADVAIAQLGTSEIDIASFSPTERKTVEALGNIKVMEAKDGGFVRIAINHKKKQFQDKRVRQAFLYAVDRQGIVDSALPGVGSVRNSSFDPTVSGDGIEKYEYNPEKAKSLLREAGWNSNTPVELAWIAGGNPDRDAAATAVASQLNEVGVKVKLQKVEAAWTTENLNTAKFDMFLFGGGNYASDSWAVNNINACDKHLPNGGNIPGFCNPALDALMKKANSSADEKQRLATYAQAAKIDNDEVPYLWLYSNRGTWAVNNRVQNFTPLHPSGFGWFHPEDWKVTGSK
ncbi:ABC transporter substrate-binding protein [Micromonospora sp. DR5-3]|nr:ABC transporter substrate-binding protein [Micromonospora sp. DR5-3]MCW3818896.1 ABC transporter substrate-binding protein [Micromonospora sp. DR5-3]